MPSQPMPQPAIQVEEVYKYDVTLKNQSTIRWNEGASETTVKVLIPYDDQLTYCGQSLGTLETRDSHLHLGDVVIKSSDSSQDELQRFTVQLPTSQPPTYNNLRSLIRSGQQLIDKRTFTVAKPAQNLVSVEGRIFDGADYDTWATVENLLIDEQNMTDFVNNLRLRLSLWVPNLFQRSRSGQFRQLLGALRYSQHNQQIILSISRGGIVEQLGQSIVALANNARGGRIILLGSDALGDDAGSGLVPLPGETDSERQNNVITKLLLALIGCSPAVPIESLSYVRNGDDKIVAAQIGIAPGLRDLDHTPLRQRFSSLFGPANAPANQFTPYRYREKVYRRLSNVTVEQPSWRVRRTERQPVMHLSTQYLRDLLSNGSADNVVMLDANRSINSINDLHLAEHICGLLNSSPSGGLLVIHNLPLDTRAPWKPLELSLKARLDELMKQVIKQCRPEPIVSKFWMTRVQRESVAVVRVLPGPMPIALHGSDDDEAAKYYRWDNRELKEIKPNELLAVYAERLGGTVAQLSDDAPKMNFAQLKWPIQPPLSGTDGTPKGVYEEEAQRISRRLRREQAATSGAPVSHEGVYEVQRQAIVWRKQPFRFDPKQSGATCHLDVSLRSGMTDIGLDGIARPLKAPLVLKGTIEIVFDNVLASGAFVDLQGAKEHPSSPDQNAPWFERIPIKRTTKLLLNIEVRMADLFIQRRKMSLAHFYVPDTLLDPARVIDICEALTDVGFRVDKPRLVENEQEKKSWMTVTGVRSKDFHDISLFAYILCKRKPRLRELRYDQRHDTQGADTAQLDCRIVLRGESTEAGAEIGELHMAINDLFNQRLQYLRSE